MQNFIIANCTDVGMRRQVNEDSMTTFDSPNGQVIAVCDGMGGQAAGDVASRLACDVIRDLLENNAFASPVEAITRSIMAANTVILNRGITNPELEGMGSTCVMAIIKDGKVYYGWVGDSRIYYFSNGQLQQVSRDQSYVQQLVDAGQLTAEEAENHPQKNEITNALGVSNMVPPDLSPVPLTPENGAIMMLCSDGLTGMVPVATIQKVLEASDMTLQEKADHLVALANAAGGIDNITVQLIEFKPAVAPSQHIATPPPAVVAARRSTNIFRWGMIAAIVIVLLLVAAFFIFKRDVPKAPTAESGSTEQVENEQHPGKKEEPKVTKVVYDDDYSEKGSSRKSHAPKQQSTKQNTSAQQIKNKVGSKTSGSSGSNPTSNNAPAVNGNKSKSPATKTMPPSANTTTNKTNESKNNNNLKEDKNQSWKSEKM